MSRPFSWYPLAPSDPVPGDPAAVQSAGVRYAHMAVTITATARQLRTLTDADGTVSEAVDAIREKAETVAGDIERAHDRYHGVGLALQSYATALAAAQAEADAALADARAAQERLDQANAAITLAQRRLDGLSDEDVDDEARARYQSQRTSARHERDDAEVALIAARTRLDAAVADRDSAAEIAIAQIEEIPSDGLDDGWWENWGSDVAQQVSTWAGRVSAIAGVASLFLGWVPILGQALTIIAVGAGVLALAADVALAVKRGDGGDWLNVGLGIVGLATFGMGKALDGAVDAFRGTAQTALATASTRSSASLLGRLRSVFSGRPQVTSTAVQNVTRNVDEVMELGTGYLSRVRGAWSEVRSLQGGDRLLALAGHGPLVSTNNALRGALLDAFPFHPRTFLSLLGPTLRGTVLEGSTAALWVGDSALGGVGIAKDAVETLTPEVGSPAEILAL